MRALLFSFLMLAAGCASAPAQSAVSADPVIAAERAFAARASEVGWLPAFREHVAADGIVLRPGPVNAPENLAQAEDDGDRSLLWWPAWAGISRSGDFGFTTGPFVFGSSDAVRGHYFTVWRRQADGSWKWIFDGGIGGVEDPTPIARDADVPTLPVAASSDGSAARAIAEVRAAEHRIAYARPAPSSSFARYLADDAHVNRRGFAPGAGRDAPVLLGSSETLIAEASSSGDLVFTLGTAHWSEDGAERSGHYARIWQRRPEGWRIVFDELIPAPPAQQGG
jgi:ketosteroid isomerase-like protein